MSYHFRTAKLSLLGNYYYQQDIEPVFRGFDFDEIELADGYDAEFRFDFRLLKIRNGLWNPNIALGDIHAGLFAQYADYQDSDETAWGAELKFDIGLLWLFKSQLTYGVTVLDDEYEPYTNITISFQ